MEEAKKNSVLIVDDEKANIITLTHILGPTCTVYASKDGLDAIEAAQKHLPDVILLDILMPEMDGYEVIEALKNNETTKAIPVIFITGLSGDDDEKKGLSLGAADYISKPFNSVIVELRVQSQLKIVNQMRALDKQLKQQMLMASISQNSLADANNDILFTSTLRMTGEFMEIAQILLFVLDEDGSTFSCRNEWIDPKRGLPSCIGESMSMQEPMLSILKSIRPGIKKDAFLYSNDTFFKAAMKPYRINFASFIATPIFINGKICGLIDFSKEDDDREWDESEISLTTHVAGIISGVFEREAMERVASAKELSEKAIRNKSEVLSRMNSQLRTPVNAILGMTEIAKNADDYNKRDEYLEKTYNASRHLLRYIDNVINISSIEDSKFVIASEDISLDAMLENVLNELCVNTDDNNN